MAFNDTEEAKESQADFSGGENSVSDPLLLGQSEVSVLDNRFAVPGRGTVCRKGFKTFRTMDADAAGRAVHEFDQSTGTILTYVAVGALYYDETMQPNYQVFGVNPQAGDIVYFGSRVPFYQLNMKVLGLVSTDYTFRWDYYDGTGVESPGAGWRNFTSTIVESVANAKKWAASGVAYTDVRLTWPRHATPWALSQVETRGYQYWIRCVLTVVGTPTGADVRIGRSRVRGDWEGRRFLVAASTARLTELPGSTLTIQNIETWPTGTQIPRVRFAQLGDYLYYASNAQRNLRRWNGGRGVSRSGASNVPSDAGLTAPTAAPTLVLSAEATAYPANSIIRYRLAFEYGPEGILGESQPGPSVQGVVGGAAEKIEVNFGAAKTQAGSLEVYSVLVYATDDLVNVTATNERDRMSGFQLVKRLYRDETDTDWIAGKWMDTRVQRIVPGRNPIEYDNKPPFAPKYVVAGGDRLWIADDNRVAWSDIGRGDSWDPENTKLFGGITGIVFDADRLFVFQKFDIQYIADTYSTLPEVGHFYRGLGCVQPDSITKGEGGFYFMSHRGPARMSPQGVRTIGRYRVWESSRYWNKKAVARSLSQGAYFEDRWWIPMDSGTQSNYLSQPTGCYDAVTDGWCRLLHYVSGPTQLSWAALSVVHAPLDHPQAGELILLGYPEYDGTNLATQASKIKQIEYGTTDEWTTVATDGIKIPSTLISRALAFGHPDRWKKFREFHSRIRLPFVGSCSLSATLLQDQGTVSSGAMASTGSNSFTSLDLHFLPTESGSVKTPYREKNARLQIVGSSDSGDEVTMWKLVADADSEPVLL